MPQSLPIFPGIDFCRFIVFFSRDSLGVENNFE